jgi:hypothetical protein
MQMPRIINAELDRVYVNPEFPLGALTEADGQDRVFTFLKYNDGDGDVDAVEGYLAVQLDTDLPVHEVTCDYTEGGTVFIIRRLPRGFAQAAFTHGTYGWFQTYGPNRKNVRVCFSTLSQGERIMKCTDDTNDGDVDPWSSGYEQVAVALEDSVLNPDDPSEQNMHKLTPGQAFITIAQ